MAARVAAPALLMTLTDVAELAEVQRPVVTNWRRRYPDFPSSVSRDKAQPLFGPQEMAGWLLQTNRVSRERAEQELALFMLAGLATSYEGRDVMSAVTALLCLRFLAGEMTPLSDGAGDPLVAAKALARSIDPNDRVLFAEVHSIPARAGWLVRLVDDLVEASWNCREAFERVMKARHRFGAGALTTSLVDPALARLIAELSGATERARRGSALVADPAAGPGDLLAAVAQLLGPDRPPAIAAAEADPALARLLRRRFLVGGVEDRELDIREAKALPDLPDEPDAIVTQVPYQPRETRDSAAAIEVLGDVAVRLSPGRFGVVLGPASALIDDLRPDSAEESERAKLLAGNMVEAVIRLPGGLVPFRPGYETALWVLTQARDSRWKGRVLLADLSGRELNHDVISNLVEDVTTWRREGYSPAGHHRVFAQQVDLRDLLDPPRPLLIGPRSVGPHDSAAEAARRVAAVNESGVELDRIGATATADRIHVPTELFTAAQAPEDTRPPTGTVGALVKNRRLALHQGTRIKAMHITTTGHHFVYGINEVLGNRRPGERMVDRALFADAYRTRSLTQPGDVLVTTQPRTGAIVDTLGYSIAEFPVRILRIPAREAELFTPRLLAALLFADGSGTRAEGAVRAARALEDQRLPLLQPHQVRQIDRVLTTTESRRELAHRELRVLSEFQDNAIVGLIDGTLTVTHDTLIGQD